MKKFKIIGAGGIGSHLVEPLARYLSCGSQYSEITVIDGDNYEEKNKERQRFTEFENKAEHTIKTMSFNKVYFKSKSEYITEDTVISSVRENDVIFLCVDNHATRKTVSDRCEELDNVVLISGGNDYTDGDVNVYIRKDGKDVTKPLTSHPDIADPKDVNPGEFQDDRHGCQEEVNSNPQLLFMNLDIASLMLNCYYCYEQGILNSCRVFSDIKTLTRRAV